MKWLFGILALALALSAGCAPAAKPAPAPGIMSRTESQGVAGAPAKDESAPAISPAAPAPVPGSSAEATAPWDRMVIRNVDIALVVKDVEDSLAAARDIAVAAGGIVTQSSTRYQGKVMLATLILQVPSDTFDATVQKLRRLAIKVESETGSSKDVTEEYVDLESQLRNLQSTEASLLRVMERANSVADILAVQRELTNVRGQIERTQGRMNYLKRRSDMSTISLSLKPEAAVEPTGGPIWKPLETARRAWEITLMFWRWVGDVIIVAAVFLWWLVPLGLAVWLLVRVRRGRRRSTPTS